jgi:hypothetical protein
MIKATLAFFIFRNSGHTPAVGNLLFMFMLLALPACMTPPAYEKTGASEKELHEAIDQCYKQETPSDLQGEIRANEVNPEMPGGGIRAGRLYERQESIEACLRDLGWEPR